MLNNFKYKTVFEEKDVCLSESKMSGVSEIGSDSEGSRKKKRSSKDSKSQKSKFFINKEDNPNDVDNRMESGKDIFTNSFKLAVV